MRKIIALLFSGCLLSLPMLSLAQSNEPNDENGEIRYISDDLYTYLHAGPGRNYRILGSVIAGTRVTMLQQDSESNFIEIIDDKQRTGWVDGDFISAQPSLRNQLPSLRKKLDETVANLEDAQQKNLQLNRQLVEVNSQNADFKRELDELQVSNQKLQRKLDTQDKSEQMEWFTRGGIIAVVGLVIGIIITYLPKKRRRNDTWM